MIDGDSMPTVSLGVLGEKGLIAHLVNAESLAVLISDGLKPELIPSVDLRDVYTFAMDYFSRNGCKEAPTIEVLRTEFGTLLDDNEIDLEVEPEATIEYVIEVLKAQWVRQVSRSFADAFSKGLGKASTAEHSEVLSTYASRLVELSLAVEPRHSRIDVREAAADALMGYEAREASKESFEGMRFGIEAIDLHTRGIHPGELAVVAAPPKAGKSWCQSWTALQEASVGRRVCMFTLELSVREMLDRIACQACEIDYTEWQRGEIVDPQEIEALRQWTADIARQEEPFWIIQPDIGQRSFEYMVREAQVREADSLLIDQLTFVEFDQSIRQRNEQIGAALHRLKAMISTGPRPIPCLLTHQINREGVKAADKVGHLEMYHMAEAAEVERTVDMGFGLYQGRDDRAMNVAKFQSLAARRFDLKHWELDWRPFQGVVKSNREIDLQ